MKRFFTFIFVSLLLTGGLSADPIKKSTALSVASNWFSQQNGNLRTSGNAKTVKNCTPVNYKGMVVYYVVEYKEGGFVIVSGDDRAKPVLGYSESNPLFSQNPVIEQWLTNYKIYVYDLVNVKQNTPATKFNQNWYRLRNNIRNSQTQRTKAVEVSPMMPDILYSQGSGWNAQCPEDTEGPSGRALVGCVATAMGQVMRFWEHPKQGRGSKTYNHSKYGSLTADFANTTYNWAAMSKSRADEHNAKLLNHCGVAVEMNYGGDGSGAYSRDVVKAFRDNFRYDPSINMIYKYNYSAANWSTKMKEELAAGRPVLYSARSTKTTNAGHLFALDGYKITDEGDYFHINWGWAGRSNGYFYLTEMVTHGGDHDWVKNNAAIINIKPLNSAPEFASITALSIAAGQEFSQIIRVSDADGDNVNVEFVSGPAWLSFAKENGEYVIKGTPNANQGGFAEVVITATDGKETTEQKLRILVKASATLVDFETNDFSQATFSFANDVQWVLTSADALSGKSAKSPKISDNQSTELSISETFGNGGAVAFEVKVSSEKNYDFLKFYIDGKEQKKWSGDVSWTAFNFAVPAGQHTLTWTYIKDPSEAHGLDGALIDNIELINNKVTPAPQTIIDFETRDFSQAAFTFADDAPWETTTAGAATGYSAKSQKIDHNQKASTSITATFGLNASVAFDRKTSSEKDYDYLQFYVDGKLIESWSGEVAWSQVSHDLTAGEHTLTWTYSKDLSVSNGSDCAWIDNIELVGTLANGRFATNNSVNATKLFQNYPNPAISTTSIDFVLGNAAQVKLEVMNLQGKVVRTLMNKSLEAGLHQTTLNTSALRKGIYICRLSIAGKIKPLTKRIMVR